MRALFAILLFSALFSAPGVASPAAAPSGSLKAALSERDLGKRSKLALDNAAAVLNEMREAGVRLALYPLTAFRMMSAAALKAYETLRREGTQKSLLDQMQTREQLYNTLNYHDYEKKLDELFTREKRNG